MEVVRRLDQLGRVSEERGFLTRTFLSPAMDRAVRLVGGWMRQAGLAVREDGFGNVIGRLEGDRPEAIVIGSHLDTVRRAGRFDGALGVLLGIAAAAEFRRIRPSPAFSLEVAGFSEEEGVRFPAAYLGSRGYLGRLTAADFRLRDAAGVTLAEALRGRKRIRNGRMRLPKSQRILAYLEAHLEQGPVLEEQGRGLGVVRAIVGQTRGRMTFVGRAGHAGTTPMRSRRDALAAAAEFILLVEGTARRRPPMVATVGIVSVSPGAGNVIPGEAEVSLDLRHPSDRRRRRAVRRLIAGARRIARRRGLGCRWARSQEDAAVGCSPRLNRLLISSVRSVQGDCPTLVSGAGHDAVALSAVAPVAMLFLRCRRGLSHHPDEFVAPADIEAGLRAMVDFLLRMDGRET